MPQYKDKAQGRAKRVVGRATGNRSMERRGTVQETKGRVAGVVKKAKRELRAGTRPARRSATRSPARRPASPARRRRM